MLNLWVNPVALFVGSLPMRRVSRCPGWEVWRRWAINGGRDKSGELSGGQIPYDIMGVTGEKRSSPHIQVEFFNCIIVQDSHTPVGAKNYLDYNHQL